MKKNFFISSTQPLKVSLIASGVLLLIFLMLLSIVTTKYYLHPTKQTRTIFKNPSNQLIYDKWYTQIKRLGGQKAYLLFKTETEKKPMKIRHNDAHLFGEALYQIEGKDGISVCDVSFNYGCYHSFLASVINSEGTDLIPELSKRCFEKSGKDGSACQHGIGHGVLSSLGYDLASLRKSIAVCHGFKNTDPVGGCLSGVFMEYNFQSMLLNEGKVRRIDENNPYFPCFDIDIVYTRACIYQQAQWWLSSLRLPSEERVIRIDSLCNGLRDPQLKTQCYKGLGVDLFAYANYDLVAAKKLCHSLNSSATEAICRSGIAILISGIPDLKKESLALCTDPSLNLLDQQLCLKQLDQIAASPTKDN